MPKVKKNRKSDVAPLIIVGNGMVSWRLCRQLVDLGVNVDRKILVFGEEPRPAYDRVNLTKYFDLDGPEDLLLAPADWYADNNIELQLGTRIVKLDPNAKIVIDDQGGEYAYGDCVLATGSHAFVPPIAGVELEKVFVYRTIEDIEAIKAAAQGARHGVVIGGGLLGLEAASVLQNLSIDTCIVQAAGGLMSRQLNQDAAGYLLREVARLGMSVRLKTMTQRIESKDDQLELHFDKGESMVTDMVIIAAGIAPNDGLASDTEISTAVRGGYIVDSRLQTQAPDVYAIGECASYKGRVYGLVAPGYEMADALARTLNGKKRVQYAGSDESCRLKLLGVEVSTFGDFMEEGDYCVYRGENGYRSLVLKRSRLIGATVVGDWEQTAQLERAVREGWKLKQKHLAEFERGGELSLLKDTGGIREWPDAALVCNCTSTNCGVLRAAIAEGCGTIHSLTEKTGAGGVCGSCQPQLAELLGDVEALKDVAKPRGNRLLWISAVIALLTLAAIFITPPLPTAQSVQDSYYKLTRIWQDSLTKQITGYTMAGLSLIAVLLSARKRLKWLNFGNYGFWRAVHSWLGMLTIFTIFFHTGLNFGENLNLWLLICFLGLNLAGGLAAIAVATEKRFSGTLGARLRAFATKAHIVFFLPYPVLLGFHIAKVYLY